MNKFLLLLAVASFLLFGCAANGGTPAGQQAYGPLSGINITSASAEELAACENLTPLNMKYWCFTNISIRTRNASYCEKIDTNYRDLNQKSSCYLEVALLNSDPELCAKVQANSNNGYCYTNVSVARKDVSICDNIADSQSKGDCYGQVAAATGDISLCDKIQVEASGTSYNFVTHQQSQYGPVEATRNAREGCYGGVANVLGDESICERITSPNTKDSCYEYMDYKILSTSLCDKIQDLGSRGICYNRLAIYKKDAAICDKSGSQANKDWCNYALFYGVRASLESNSSSLSREERLKTTADVCDAMETSAPKDKCYWVAVQINGNYSLCQKIQNSYYKQQCEAIESATNSLPHQCLQMGDPPLPCP